MNKIFAIISVILVLNAANLPAETAFEAGERLFYENKPLDARPQLESALLKDSGNEIIYYHLGIIYHQLNDPQNAIETLRRGLALAKNLKDKFYFEMADIYFIQGDNILSEKNYSLVIAENSLFADAYLNRANTRVRLVKYKDAIEDYKTYLRLKPDAPQRVEIEKLIKLLEESIDEQKDLLDSVLNSINNASTNTQTQSAGTEDFQKTGDKPLDIIE
jgi:tetratricopeptide (TPR) repeat protein